MEMIILLNLRFFSFHALLVIFSQQNLGWTTGIWANWKKQPASMYGDLEQQTKEFQFQTQNNTHRLLDMSQEVFFSPICWVLIHDNTKTKSSSIYGLFQLNGTKVFPSHEVFWVVIVAPTTATEGKCIASPVFFFVLLALQDPEKRFSIIECVNHMFFQKIRNTHFRGHQMAAAISWCQLSTEMVPTWLPGQWLFLFRILLEFSKHRNLDGMGARLQTLHFRGMPDHASITHSSRIDIQGILATLKKETKTRTPCRWILTSVLHYLPRWIQMTFGQRCNFDCAFASCVRVSSRVLTTTCTILTMA